MPKRTDDFQKVVRSLYEAIVPAGGTVTESAMVPERIGGAMREIDILVNFPAIGHSHSVAIECRKRGREQTIEWIDGLIGKYSNLPVDKVIAISASPFTKAARVKARARNIELITVNEALTGDWKARIEQFEMMTQSHTLQYIGCWDKEGREICKTELDREGTLIRHVGELASKIYPFLSHHFMSTRSAHCANLIQDLIGQNWQMYFEDRSPRWIEFGWDSPELPSEFIGENITSIKFGVGTYFHFAKPTQHFALKKFAISTGKMDLVSHSGDLQLVTNEHGELVNVKFKIS
ncbi:restriction endonuclease [uncultured Alsobacter sp.]|uniref:restriction endonuclease n=1 Tax=uncultured Alsobacter sp. TaxID=1748258 RepID=UPI0025DC728C|nr:restriction endonuclease [uncultured Alsobacter sp.]